MSSRGSLLQKKSTGKQPAKKQVTVDSFFTATPKTNTDDVSSDSDDGLAEFNFTQHKKPEARKEKVSNRRRKARFFSVVTQD